MSTAATPPAAARDTRLLVLATVLCYLTISAYVAVLPRYVVERVGGSTAAVGIAMGAAALAAVLLRPAAGRLGDRYGRRPAAVAGAALMALGPVVLLGPGVLALVVVARVCVGAGDALFTTATLAWVVDAAPPERRGRAMAAVGMAIWLGLALGPQAGALAFEHGGPRAVWLASALAALVATVLVRCGSPPAPRPRSAPAGRGSLIPVGAAVPALAMLLACFGQGVFEAFGVLHLVGQGLSPGAGIGGAASVFSVVAVTTFVGRFAGGALVDAVSPRAVAAGGALLVAGSYAILAVAGSFVVAAGGAAVLGVGLALIYPALGVLVTEAVPPEARGAGLGVYLAAMDLAFALGPLAGAVIVASASTGVALWIGAAVAATAVPLMALRGGAGAPAPQAAA